MIVRRELRTDHAAVRSLHLAAFDRPSLMGRPAPEAVLVDELRADGDSVPALTLVAQASLGGEVLGHVMVSRATVDDRPSLGLGPIGVLPDHQGKGVGSALMHAVLAAADAMGERAVVLLGHAEYYPRFGFEPAEPLGVLPPSPWSQVSFLVRRLSAWDDDATGAFRYAPAFERLDDHGEERPAP